MLSQPHDMVRNECVGHETPELILVKTSTERALVQSTLPQPSSQSALPHQWRSWRDCQGRPELCRLTKGTHSCRVLQHTCAA